VPELACHLRAEGELAGLGLQIEDMHGRPVDGGTPRHRCPVEVPLLADERADRTVMRHDAQPHPNRQVGDAVGGSADTRGGLRDGLEHWLDVRRRARDHAEDLGRGRLLGEAVSQFTMALLQFLEQPHVFHGDDGLVGEGLEKRDLPLGERADDSSRRRDGAERPSILDHRNSENRSKRPQGLGSVRILAIVGHLNHGRGQDRASRHAAVARSLRKGAPRGIDLFPRPAVLGHEVDALAVEPEQPGEVRLAQRRGRGGDGFEGWLHCCR